MTTHQPRDRLLIDLADIADELCDPHQHTEAVYDRDPKHRNKRMRRAYVTVQDGLLTQLAQAVTESSAEPGEGGGGIARSRPPGAWEAMARHTSITIAVFRWCWDLRLPPRGTVERNLRQLVGAAPSLNEVTSRRLLAEMRSWRHQAAVMTGWATPSFAPQVACPQCTRVGTLRINLDRQVALCTACNAMWDGEDGSIGVLARYIETASEVRSTSPVRIRSGRVGNGDWHNGPAGAPG